MLIKKYDKMGALNTKYIEVLEIVVGEDFCSVRAHTANANIITLYRGESEEDAREFLDALVRMLN